MPLFLCFFLEVGLIPLFIPSSCWALVLQQIAFQKLNGILGVLVESSGLEHSCLTNLISRAWLNLQVRYIRVRTVNTVTQRQIWKECFDKLTFFFTWVQAWVALNLLFTGMADGSFWGATGSPDLISCTNPLELEHKFRFTSFFLLIRFLSLSLQVCCSHHPVPAFVALYRYTVKIVTIQDLQALLNCFSSKNCLFAETWKSPSIVRLHFTCGLPVWEWVMSAITRADVVERCIQMLWFWIRITCFALMNRQHAPEVLELLLEENPNFAEDFVKQPPISTGSAIILSRFHHDNILLIGDAAHAMVCLQEQ